MTRERLLEIIAAYGADPQRWPDNERADAVAYMTSNPDDIQSAMQQARSLDDALDTEQKNVSSTDFLAARILKAAQSTDTVENPANDYVSGPAKLPKRQPLWRSVAATFIVTTGVGFAMGQSAAAKSARIAEAETLLSLTLDDPYDNDSLWEDLS